MWVLEGIQPEFWEVRLVCAPPYRNHERCRAADGSTVKIAKGSFGAGPIKYDYNSYRAKAAVTA